MLYKEAARILQLVEDRRGSVNNLTFASSFKNKRQLMALVCETLKFNDILRQILDTTRLAAREKSLNEGCLLKVMLYDFLFGKGLQGSGLQQEAIQRHAEELTTELERLKADAGVSDSSGLLKPTQNACSLPRYVRVNTIRLTVTDAVKHFQSDGYKLKKTKDCAFTDYLGILRSLTSDEFVVDIHVPELLVFAAGTDFHEHELYLNGSIVLQDKASCLPAVVLNPPPGSHVIDCCAAPGNKTTQLAALVHHKGKVFAFDKDRQRLATMKSLLMKVGAAQIIETSCEDFLRVDPRDPRYSHVEYVLVDPSCSGSGIVSRSPEAENDDRSSVESRLHSLASFQAMIVRHAMSFPSARRVVYSTCSIHEQENERVVKDVLSRINGMFRLVDSMPSLPCRGMVSVFAEAERCLRLSSESCLTNGFFVACFERERSDDGVGLPTSEAAPSGVRSSPGCRLTSSESDVRKRPREKKKEKLKDLKRTVAPVETKTSSYNAEGLKVKTKRNKKHRKLSARKPVTA